MKSYYERFGENGGKWPKKPVTDNLEERRYFENISDLTTVVIIFSVVNLFLCYDYRPLIST